MPKVYEYINNVGYELDRNVLLRNVDCVLNANALNSALIHLGHLFGSMEIVVNHGGLNNEQINYIFRTLEDNVKTKFNWG